MLFGFAGDAVNIADIAIIGFLGITVFPSTTLTDKGSIEKVNLPALLI
jgi:hypothetical protein